jgi:hypothetical protein
MAETYASENQKSAIRGQKSAPPGIGHLALRSVISGFAASLERGSDQLCVKFPNDAPQAQMTNDGGEAAK